MSPTAGGLAYREATPDGPERGDPVLLVHGYPESSYMWRDLMPRIAAAGFRAVAPDLPGFGDSPADPPGTWDRAVAAVGRFHEAMGLGPVTLVVHDWGGLIALRWACDNPGAVGALVIADSGFFADGKWHGLADVLRTEGQGEELLENMTREAFGGMLAGVIPGIGEDAVDEYWKAFTDETRRRGQLELYRSGDFSKLEPYEGRLAALGVPSLILWGSEDQFAPVAGAHRFGRELPGARVVLIEGAGHFVFEEAPEECAATVIDFLQAPTPG
ncbi:MAG TPA: alpha/beta fold hydrolase [Thermoleophilaceae bacterium]|nr:alpha/beta fold hydrolase [Thermoleophilaceae bacterium]